MTAKRTRPRSESGWMVAGQLVLAVAALFSLPLGAGDGGGVSSILPALRSTLAAASAEASADAGAPRAEKVGEGQAQARRLSRRRLGRRVRHLPTPASWRPSAGLLGPTTPPCGPRQSRAPPLVR